MLTLDNNQPIKWRRRDRKMQLDISLYTLIRESILNKSGPLGGRDSEYSAGWLSFYKRQMLKSPATSQHSSRLPASATESDLPTCIFYLRNPFIQSWRTKGGHCHDYLTWSWWVRTCTTGIVHIRIHQRKVGPK